MNKLILPTIIISLALSPGSWAKSHHGKANWAKVTHVEPITRTIEHRFPQQECWNEQVRYQQDPEGGRSYTGTILGGIIGGAIGNKVGHNKTNKKIATVVGAVLGASVGHDLSDRHDTNSGSDVFYRNERHCETHDAIRYEEKVIGYHVWYRYHGDEYQTRMNSHPGKKIKVHINIEPY
ncbi:MAG: hypothetical protein ACJAT7_001498 [Psychromonas sp.]|jgi:uncharacterized protein YcfJ|uniref:glycine zipper 2TM domain-containing protein n=1 Tax=Psychromonas sp. TaxID=1884585 RepID=UPI0039E63D5D